MSLSKSLAEKSRRQAVPSEREADTVAPVIGIDASGPASIDSESRRAMTAESAYYLAEQRPFEPGHELDDWLSAEREVERGCCLPHSDKQTLCRD